MSKQLAHSDKHELLPLVGLLLLVLPLLLVGLLLLVLPLLLVGLLLLVPVLGPVLTPLLGPELTPLLGPVLTPLLGLQLSTVKVSPWPPMYVRPDLVLLARLIERPP